MDINILDYWKIITTYTNPIHIATQTILYIVLFFFVALILVILLRKIILVKRVHLSLKYLSYCYLIGIPLLSGFFGFKYGLANAVQKDLKTHIDAYTQQMQQHFNSDSTFDITMILAGNKNLSNASPHISTNEAIDLLSEYFYNRYGEVLEQTSKKDGTVNGKISYLFLKITKSKGIAFMIKKGIKNIVSEKVGLGEDVTADLLDTKIDELIKDGLLKKIVVVEIDKVFGSIKSGVLLTLGFILLLCGIEIGIANYKLRKAIQNPIL